MKALISLSSWNSFQKSLFISSSKVQSVSTNSRFHTSLNTMMMIRKILTLFTCNSSKNLLIFSSNNNLSMPPPSLKNKSTLFSVERMIVTTIGLRTTASEFKLIDFNKKKQKEAVNLHLFHLMLLS